MRRLTLLLIALCALAGAAAAPAGAQEDGVFYDSDDAAGKEYAIPTEEARRGGRDREDDAGSQAGGGGGEDTSGSGGGDGPRAGDGAPLFGSGISRKGRAADDSEISRARSLPPRASIESASGDTSPLVWMGGLAFVVLLLGAGGAFAVRRRQTA